VETETVLVTGGAGFIGSALCRVLLARGTRVVAYDNLSFGGRGRLPDDPRCVLIEGDVRDPVALRRALHDAAPRAVCHLAALHFIPYCIAHPEEAMDVNVNGTRQVLDACRLARPEALLFASTAAVYPAEEGPFAEEHAPGPIDVYGATKLMGEDLVRAFALETGVSTVIARLFNAFGPRDTNPHLIPDVLAQLGEGDTVRLGNLEPVRDYVHLEDLAAALVELLGTRRDGCAVFNVGSGEGRSVREVLAAFEAAIGRPVRVVQDPDRVRRVERPRLVADAGKLRETGWRPRVGFDEGIRRLAAGLRAQAG
jgi:UDP-glucose 4-epimerase